ncbi:MAG: hypothetical protein V1779_15900 [bacterium]
MKKNDVVRFGIAEAQKKGVGKLVHLAEDNGFVMLERSTQPVAFIIPVTPIGYKIFIDKIRALLDTDIKTGRVPEEILGLTYVLRGATEMTATMFNDKISR